MCRTTSRAKQLQLQLQGGTLMSDILFEGKSLTLYEAKDNDQNPGIIIACGNVHLFLALDATSELVSGLNQVAYELFKTRNEIFQ